MDNMIIISHNLLCSLDLRSFRHVKIINFSNNRRTEFNNLIAFLWELDLIGMGICDRYSTVLFFPCYLSRWFLRKIFWININTWGLWEEDRRVTHQKTKEVFSNETKKAVSSNHFLPNPRDVREDRALGDSPPIERFRDYALCSGRISWSAGEQSILEYAGRTNPKGFGII